MFRTGTIALLLFVPVMFLGACSHEEKEMQSQLDSIRLMVKQSAVLAVQAACSPPESRPDMIKASVTMLRRAMGGPEMEMIHKMMGQMPDSSDGTMPMKSAMVGDKKGKHAAQMKIHVAIHDAGEYVFELLDSLGGDKSPTCKDMQPAQLAATAALIRERQGADMDRLQQQLDQRSKHFMRSDIPDTVGQLVQALGRI
ncbi:MAG: hypothetical protein Q9M12_03340 [Mariprofundus sp.]|nr:hypothetical protein [Mariprofundus sp.]